MAIFVVTLFLPYTANFEPNKTKDGKDDDHKNTDTKTPETKGGHAMSKSLDSLPAIPDLLTPAPGFPPRTASSTNLEELLKSGAPSKRPPLLRLPSAPRLASLTRADTHSPGWGRPGPEVHFAQPSSRAKSPPPSSILRHKGLPDPTEDDDNFSFPTITRSAKNFDSFEYEKYSIEPSHMSNGGLVAAIDATCDNKIWVGTLGMPTNALSDETKTSIQEKLEVDFESVSVWVNDDDMNGLYEQYCKTILWPHLHYQIPDHPKSKAYQDHSWGFYVKVNEAFANMIVKSWKKGDKIWIHDYHLMLVPDMVRKKLPDAEIGFFMHAAFPSSEIFRCLASRKSLLEGLLGANMVGFQTDEYAHHFRQTCSRLLNVEATNTGLLMEDGRFVHVGAFALGVDPLTVQTLSNRTEVGNAIESIAEQYYGQKVIIARDKMDGLRGVLPNLLAYERFLRDFPKHRADTVLIQIATSTTTEDVNFVSRVLEVVSRINSSYSTLTHNPLLFLNVDLEPNQWTALLQIADCLMITSLREGMNLTGHEFVLCQNGSIGRTKHSPLILSEFTGAASVLKDNALLVNPWHKTAVAQALEKALRMTPEEKFRRWEKMHEAVVFHDASKWYQDYMNALSVAHQDHAVRDASSVPRLSVPQLKKTYESASKRLLILDYEGTLAHWIPGQTVLATPKRSSDILNDLLDDDRNIVYVMSARPKQDLQKIFQRVSGLGLIAENGAFLRKAGQNTWEDLCNQDHTEAWKEGVISVLTYYQDRIEGSWVEELDSCVLFIYDQAEDAENALHQAAECANHINDLCAAQGVQAVPIDRGIFVSDMKVNKATAASKITDDLCKAHSENGELFPELLLVIGDSREDEYVFDWAHQMREAGIKDCITVTVGQRNTAASCMVAQGVVGVLSALRKMIAPNL